MNNSGLPRLLVGEDDLPLQEQIKWAMCRSQPRWPLMHEEIR